MKNIGILIFLINGTTVEGLNLEMVAESNIINLGFSSFICFITASKVETKIVEIFYQEIFDKVNCSAKYHHLP